MKELLGKKFMSVIGKAFTYCLLVYLAGCSGAGENPVDDFLGKSIGAGEKSLTYSATLFNEAVTDGGAVDDTISITVVGDIFNGANGSDFVANGKISVSNVPAGLTPVITKSGATTLSFALTGNAVAHTSGDDVSNISVTFNDTAFTDNAAAEFTDTVKTGIQIQYNVLQLIYSTSTFSENLTNDGTISNTAVITLQGDTFSGSIGDNMVGLGKITVTNLTAGLTASIVKSSNNTATVTLNGTASTHTDLDDAANLTFTFQDSAFSINNAVDIDFSNRTDLILDYINPATLTYSSKLFDESSANDGTIGNSLTIDLANDAFTGNNGDDFVAGGKVVVSNTPVGLTPVITRTSPTQLSFSLTGTAGSHLDTDDIANLTATFNVSAFTFGNNITLVQNYNTNDITVDFDDPVSLSYSLAGVTESIQNVGGISQTITINLANDTFSGTVGENFIATSKVNISNLPAGLIALMTMTSSTQAVLSFLGSATSHANSDDVSNFTVNFAATAFTNSSNPANIVNANRNDLTIDFADPYTLAYGSSTFTETPTNDGTVSTAIGLTLTGTTFNASVSDNLVAAGKLTVANVPGGLTAVCTVNSATTATLTLTGTAASHINANDISNLTFTFQDTAFTSGEADGVTNSNRTDLAVDFNDPASIAYSGGTFNENVTNVGNISTTLTMTLTNDTFSGTNGDNFVGAGKVSVSNLPAGLTAVITRTSATTLDATLTGTAAAHANANSISNLRFTFQNTAFSNVLAATAVNYDKSDINITYLDPYTLNYSTGAIVEGGANDGSITDTITLNLLGTTFTGSNGDDFVAGAKVAVSNLPAGLTVTAVKQSNSQILVSFTGNATLHANANSITNLTFVFQNTAFASGDQNGVTNFSKNDISITYDDPPTLSYLASSFNESIGNIGGTTDVVNLVLTNKTFNGTNGDDLYAAGKVTASNVPTGLTPVVTMTSPTLATLTFSGNATSHANANDVSNITITFQDTAFVGGNAVGVVNYDYNTISFDFIDPYTLSYNVSTINENSANDGSITETISLTLIGTTFTGNNGDDFVAGGKLVVTNLPAGLTAVATRDSSSGMTLSFTGNAASHDNADDVSNVTFTFQDTAFASGAAAGVTDYNKNDVYVDFRDQATIGYSGSTFSEAVANTGTISNTITLTISNDTFSGSNGDNFIANSKASTANLPTGLTASLTRTSSTTMDLVLSGSASAHANANDVSNFTITFVASAFDFNSVATNVVNYTKNDIAIDYADPYNIAYSGGTFTEAAANDGSFSASLTLTLTGTTYTGMNGDNFITDTKATVTNVPAGLTATLIRTSPTVLTLSLTGNATNHLNSNDISNLTVTLLDSGVTSGSASGVVNYIKNDIVVDYADQPSLAYGSSTFNEENTNIGRIDNTITVTLTGETFTGNNGDDFVAASKVVVTNLPVGLTVQATRTSATTIDLTLGGAASAHDPANNISNLQFAFQATAFTSVAPANVTSSTKSDFNVSYLSPYSISYSGGTLNESTGNDGSVSGSININLVGTTYAGNNGDDFVALSRVNVTNVPTGLTAVVTRNSTTQLALTLTGNASSHANSDDISSLTVTFLDAAFSVGEADGVLNRDKSDIIVDFNDADTLSYAASNFNEAAANDGSISGTITVTLAGDTFTGSNSDNFVTASKITPSNVPTGLTVVATRTSATTIDVTITGNASSHANANDISNLTLTFENSAFTNNTSAANVTNYAKSDLSIDYEDPASLSYGTASFSESFANDGSISNTIVITLSGDTLTGNNGDNFITGSKITPANVPTGLTAVVTRTSSTTLNFTLTGNASSHSSGDDISNLTLTFEDSAFTNNTSASNVTNYTKADFSVNYDAPASLNYASATFVEALANDGSISSSINIDLLSDTLTGNNGDNFVADSKITVTNMPAGLTAVATRASTSQLNVTITGNAAAHANTDDISNLTFTFEDSAFTNNATASNVTNYLKNNLVLDYSDPATLSYSGSNFNEAGANDGSVTDTITVTLSGDTFSGSNGDNFITDTKATVTNVPAGLTAVLTKSSDTQVALSFTGNAGSHIGTDDVSNVTITFLNTAFTNNSTASNVTNYTRADLSIDFNDPATLSYSGNNYNEALANDGSISGSITVTLIGDTFTGNNGDDFVGGGKVFVTNLPAGLTANANRDSATQLTVTLTGNSGSHVDADDLANLTYTFQNSAFTNNTAASNVTNYLKNDISINFNDPALISYGSSNFNEAGANDGSITDTILLTLSGDTFSGSNGDNFIADSKITVANLPAGLTAVANKDSDDQITISITGNASSHSSTDSIANLTLTFQNTAFTNNSTAANVLNYNKNNLTITYTDPPNISYASTVFSEALSNDGAISGSIVLTLVSDTFTGSNGDNFVADSKIVVTNLPAGLTAVANRDSTTQITITLTGNATSHANSNDVSNLTFTFQNTAFTNTALASSVIGYNKNDISVDFADPATIVYNSSSMAEALSNDGAFSSNITIDIFGDTFTGSNGDNFVTDSKINVTNLPAGLTGVVTRTSTTRVTLTLTGNAAAHGNANDISNLTLTFQDSAFTNNTTASNITNYAKSDLGLDFADPASLSYSASTFNEAGANDGSITDTSTVTITGDTFSGTNGDNFVADSKIAVANLPAGLTAVATRTSATTIDITISGNAAAHANTDDISNLTFTFQNTAFTNNAAASNIINYNKNDIGVNFNDPATLAYSSSNFNEALANDGSISGSITIDVSGDTFTGNNGDNFVADSKITVTNMPAGLTAVATRSSATQLSVTITGNAGSHADANDVSNISFTFQNTAFTNNAVASNVTNYNKSDIAINFNDPATIAYSGSTFNEANANDGSISNTLTITLSGDTFSGNNGDNFVTDSKITVTNLPAGLTAVATRTGTSTIDLTITGNAAAHANANSISNLTYTFENSAFTNNTAASNVTNYAKSDVAISYDDPATLVYSSSNYNEALANDGSITGSVTIDLAGDTFTGNNGDNFVADSKLTVTNLPAGLTAVATRASSTQVSVTITGNAASHLNSDDISNLTYTFEDSAFTNNTSASNITNYAKSDLSINFSDPANIAYSGSTYNEALANNGSISGSLTITLSGDTFTGTNGDDFVGASKLTVTNLPAGLTAVATRSSATQLSVTITGNAGSHANTDDVSNVTFTFEDSAFTNNASASNVTNYAKSDITVDYADPATLAYSGSTFNEASSNDGAVSTTITVTLSGDTYSGTNGNDFVADSKLSVTNLPIGLTAVATRTSDTTIDLTITGNATSHANVDDISNLTYTFQDNAFTNNAAAANITNYTRADLAINYEDPASLSYSASSLTEALANDGSITATFNIDLIGDTYSGTNGDNFIGVGKIVATNVPAGLTIVATRSTNNRIVISATGNAAAHADANDVSNLTLTFQNTAFTNNSTASNVTNYARADILVDYNDPANLIYVSSNFTEAGANDGSIGTTVVINIAGDTFSGSNGDNFVADSKITVTNLPAGLTAVANRDSTTQLTVSLTGNASNHLDVDDISNLTFTFQNTAFTNNATASNVTNYNRSDLSVDFNNPATLSYGTTSYSEGVANDGSISDTITIDLVGDTFTGSNGDNFVADSKLTVTNLPAGLTAVATRSTTTRIIVSLTGNASSHASSDSISNLTYTFEDSAFTSTANASDVSNSAKSDLAINYDDPANVSYAASVFNEASSNDGSISSSIVATLVSDTFTGNNGDDFVAGSKLVVSNLPAGLTVVANRDSPTQMTFTITGNAAAHANANDISNLTFTYQNTAFTNNATASNVTNYAKADFAINFDDPASLSYSGATFSEGVSNDGSISTTITLTLTGDTFTGANGENYVTATKLVPTNVPTGLTVVTNKTSATTVDITMTGNASAHASANDITNLTFTFTDSAFTNNSSAANVTNYVRSDLAVSYNDPATLAYSGSTFTEALSNDGAVGNSLVITLAGDTFSGSNGDNFVADSKISVANIPAGLTAVANRDSATQITLTLTGNASSHANANDVTNLTYTFQNSAFTNNSTASNVTNYARADIAADYNDPATLTYGSTTFAEALANDGSFTGASVVLTLVGDTFTGNNGDDFVAASKITPTNLPAGLTLIANRDSATQITFTITGNAAAHADANDVANLTFTFANTAFTNNSAASNVTNYAKNDLSLNFNDPANLTYGSSNFTEALTNNGSFAGSSVVVTLTGDTFSGNNGDDFVAGSKVTVTNLPAGLTAVANRDSITQITFTLTGTAAAHANANDISNLTFTFANSAFTNNAAAANVTNYNKNDFTVDFADPATLSYSASNFIEAASNTGSLSGSNLTITVAGDTYAGTIGDDFVALGRITPSNLPAGLTVVANKDSNSQLTISITGNAAAHADANDVSNLTLTFNDTAFTNNASASNVTNYQKNDLVIDFNDPAVLAYSGSLFTEDLANAGITSSSITITITGDTFSGGNGSNFITDTKITPSNVPTGYTASVIKDNDTQLTFTLTGTASSHVDADDISNLTLTFASSAFTGNTIASNVTNYVKNDFSIDFNDPYALTYSTDTFTEHTNDDGTISNTVTISLAGTTFTGSVSDNFVSGSKVTVTNVPAGLTASVIKDSDTQLTFSLTGTASSPHPANDVTNLTVVFDDSAFAINNASLVADYSRNNLIVDFFANPINAPTGLSISAVTNNSLTITWTDNATNEQSYRVEQCDGASCDTTFVMASFDNSLAVNSTTHTFTGLTEGNFYRFRVRGENAATQSNWATTDLAVVFGGITSTDNGTGTSTEFKNINCVGVEGTYIVLYWPSIAGANTYDIYDETSGSTLVANVDSSTTSYTITNLDFNTAYKYRVAVNMTNGTTSMNSATTDLTSSATFAPCLVLGGGSTEASTGLYDMYNPSDVHIYGTKMFIADERNDRVLIWNTLPTSANTAPDVIIGQDFVEDKDSNVIGISNYDSNDGTPGGPQSDIAANVLNAPSSVWAGNVGGSDKLVIADRGNHRILIWNTIPTTNHVAADLVVGQPGMTTRTANYPNREFGLNNPYGVYSDGTKLYIADYDNHRVNIYNTFPTSNGAGPDVCLANTNCTSATSGRDDDNMNRPIDVLVAGTKLLVADYNNHRVLVWNTIPTGHTDPASVVIGQTNFTNGGNSTANNRMRNPRGIGYDTVNDDLYVSDYNNHRIKVFSTIPTTNGVASTHVIGFSNTANTNGAQQGRVRQPRGSVAVSGSTVYAPDTGNHRIKVFTTIPSADNTSPNFNLGYQGDNLTGMGNMGGTLGATIFAPRGVAYDSTNDQLFVSDYANHRVLVWDGFPTSLNQAADFVIGQPDFTTESAARTQFKMNLPQGMCIGGGKLWVADYNNRRFMVWNLPITATNQGAQSVLGQTSWTAATGATGYNRMRSPTSCFYDDVNDRFFITDINQDKVMMWDGIPNMADETSNPAADYIIGDEGGTALDSTDIRDPYGVTSDGTYIYVADSSTAHRRIMAFPIPTADDPVASFVLGQPNFTTADNSQSQKITRRPWSMLYHDNRLYSGDIESNRVTWWDAPGTPATTYQDMAGIYGHNGDDWNDSRQLYYNDNVGTDVFALATDGKRMIMADYYNKRIIIVPLKP